MLVPVAEALAEAVPDTVGEAVAVGVYVTPVLVAEAVAVGIWVLVRVGVLVLAVVAV